MNLTPEQIVTLIIGIFPPLLVFFIKGYLKKINKEIENLGTAITKVDAKFDVLSSEIRSNTVEMVKLKSEVNAIWRFVDAKARATDVKKVEEII